MAVGVKILVVDDNRLNVRLLTNIFEKEGYEVYSLDNGLDVLKTADKIRPDIILLDIVMPGMDGFEVCSLLKKFFDLKDIPVIMVTAKSEGADIRKALDAGALDYIKKPVNEDEVIARVKSALNLKYYQDKLKEMAMKDGLTGLYNHSLLLELFEKEIIRQRRKNGILSFAMVDIDYFKKVNDTYGHLGGDSILKEISLLVQKMLRRSDIIGRYGGEEFGIVLPEVNSSNAYELCERIRSAIDNSRFTIGSNELHVTVSIGIYTMESNDDITYSQIIEMADYALYAAKKNGRNRTEVFKS